MTIAIDCIKNVAIYRGYTDIAYTSKYTVIWFPKFHDLVSNGIVNYGVKSATRTCIHIQGSQFTTSFVMPWIIGLGVHLLRIFMPLAFYFAILMHPPSLL